MNLCPSACRPIKLTHFGLHNKYAMQRFGLTDIAMAKKTCDIPFKDGGGTNPPYGCFNPMRDICVPVSRPRSSHVARLSHQRYPPSHGTRHLA